MFSKGFRVFSARASLLSGLETHYQVGALAGTCQFMWAPEALSGIPIRPEHEHGTLYDDVGDFLRFFAEFVLFL